MRLAGSGGETVNHIGAKTGPACIACHYHRKLAESLFAKLVCRIRHQIDIDHFKLYTPAFHRPFCGVTLNAVISCVNSNAHDSYFHLK